MTIERIKNAFDSDQKMVFFVGAGISEPSKVPLSKKLNECVIRSIIGNNKLQNNEYDFLSEEIRPEVMLQIGIDVLGKECINSLEMLLGYKPNFNHIFYAEAIRRGNWVFTTNLENLTEDAYRELTGIKINRCYKNSQFKKFVEKYKINESPNPKNIPGWLFKLHGTIEEGQKGKERFRSISVALNQVGQGLDKSKKKVLAYFLKNYDFCFMGYSCLDDFSVYPVLDTNSNKKVFWFQYKKGEDIKSIPKEKIKTEIGEEEKKEHWKGEKTNWEIINVDRFLLKRSKRSKVLKFVGDSSKFVRNKLCPSLGVNITSLKDIKKYKHCSFAQWCKKNIEGFKRNIFTGRLFEQVGEWGKAIEYHEKAEKEAKRKDKRWELIARKKIADLYYKQTELEKEEEAIRIYENLIKESEKLEDSDVIAANLKIEIANVNRRVGKYPANLKKWREEFKKEIEVLKNRDMRGYAAGLVTVGLVNLRGSEDDIKIGLSDCKKSRKIREYIGDKEGVADSDNAIGLLLTELGKRLSEKNQELAKKKLNDAITHLRDAIRTRKPLGFFRGCAQCHRNIGDAYKELMKLRQNEKEKLYYFKKAKKEYEDCINYISLIKPKAPIGEVLNWRQRISWLYNDLRELTGDIRRKKMCVHKIISVYKKDLNLFSDQKMFHEIKHKEKEYNRAMEILNETKSFCEEIDMQLESQEIENIIKKLSMKC